MKMRASKRFIRRNSRRHGVEMSRYTWPKFVEVVHPDMVFDIGAIVRYVRELRAGIFST